MKIEHGKSKFHEVELDCSVVHIFPNSEHVAGRNYRLVKTLRHWARRRYVSVEIVQGRLKDNTVTPSRSTSQAACKPVHDSSIPKFNFR